MTDRERGRRGKIPLPVEIRWIIAEAEQLCDSAAARGQQAGGAIRCGAPFPGTVAGAPVLCDLAGGHTLKIKHRNRKLGCSWFDGSWHRETK